MTNGNQYLRWFILTCVFIVPLTVLYVSNSSFFPYIAGKNLLFRVLTEAAFGGWLLLMLLGGMPRPRITPVSISIAVFVTIVALADFTGIAPWRSFWSNFERMDGLVMLLHATAYFIVAGSVLNTHKLWLRFWQVSLGVSMIVGLGALSELGEGMTRISGSMGNPIYLAVYAFFHMFIASILAYKTNDRLLKWLYIATIGFNAMVLWFTATRGALLGLVTGTIIAALGVAIFARGAGHRTLRKLAIALMAGVIVAGGILFAVKDTEFAQSNTMIQRLASVTEVGENERSTGALRIMVWKTALEGVKERPLLGWGQENFNYVFNKYYNPKMYWAEQWYDRTHNIILDWLVTTGVLGLLSYLAMYLVICIGVIRAKYFDAVESSILIGLLAAYGVHNLFVFDHLVSYVLFFSLAAWLHSTVSLENIDKEPYVFIRSKMAQAIAIIVIVLSTFVVMYSANHASHVQNKVIIKALVAASNPQTIPLAQELFEEAISYESTGTQEAREQFIQVASRIASNKEVDQADKSVFVNRAIAQMQKQMDEYPDDARFPHLIGGVLSSYGENDKAKPFLEKALELSPNKIGFLVALGSNAALREDFTAAQDYYKRALELAPSNEKAQRLLDIVSTELK